ncbi:DUF1543 domain-containing protein [Sphingobacterium sp. CZ-2]|uniref:DUF1543 domain-containing protein n=1 Tax=Sphingobacterium sp. CZ-2 TaxID=2557994 RepID=UPI00106FEAAD|nr:DUF1543 domain-containing protein [Sphingobacterium sp. CZ-2]QBR13106.1 DUF1543 domain-containing protein [Sphingobacterium sp. CZ-2]
MDLYMLVIGGKPLGRHIEQHDVFFGIAEELKDLVPAMKAFWPEMDGKMHIDSWRKVSRVGGFKVFVKERMDENEEDSDLDKRGHVALRDNLFFVNLGGYKPNDMEEYHYKQLVVAKDLAEASRIAKQTVFWKHHESSHIDDKYGIDVDDIYNVEDLLTEEMKGKYKLVFEEVVGGDGEGDGEMGDVADNSSEDKLEVGYLKLSKLGG